MRTTAAAACLAVNPHAVAQGKTANDFRRDENILRCLNKIALRIAQEPEPLARNLNDAFAEFRFSLNLFAIFDRSFGTLARLPIQRFNPGICAVRIDNR